MLIQKSTLHSTLIAILAILSLIYTARLAYDFPRINKTDLLERHREIRILEQGYYPRVTFYPDDKITHSVNSVYPPYAFPMLWFLVPFSDYQINRTWMTAINLFCAGMMAGYGWKLGRAYGWRGSALLALSTTAFFALSTNLLGAQLGLLVNALLVLMLTALNLKRPWRAGVFWMLAMIKPQNSLFAVILFFKRATWKPVLAATGILIGLSQIVAEYCDIPLRQILSSMIFSNLHQHFIRQGNSITSILAQLDISPVLLTMAGLAGSLLIVFLLRRRLHARVSPLVELAVLLGIMRVVFYHRPYDNIMLVFLILALGQHALEKNKLHAWLAYLWTGLTVWLPMNLPSAPSGKEIVRWLSEISRLDIEFILRGLNVVAMITWICAMFYLVMARQQDARSIDFAEAATTNPARS